MSLVDSFKDLSLSGQDRLQERQLARQTVREMESAVNSFGYRPVDIGNTLMSSGSEEVTNLSTALAVSWIPYWGVEKSFLSDGRNEIACEVAKQISEMPEFARLDEEVCTDIPDEYWQKAGMICEGSLNMHRTLMQSWSSVMFYILSQIKSENAASIDVDMTLDRGNAWWRMPLI